MDPTLRAMLNAVIAEPNDITLRMICADRYEELEETVECEHCSGRGSVDRLVSGLVVARMACKHCYGGRLSNLFIVRATQIRNQCENPGSVRPSREPEFGDVACVWQRGFIRDVSCTMAEWEKHGPAICDQHPVERVVITDKEPHVPDYQTQAQYPGRNYVWFYNYGDDSWECSIPGSLLDNKDYVFFEERGDAFDWLSQRCIETARAKATQLTTCDLPG